MTIVHKLISLIQKYALLVILIVTAIVYAPTLNNDFVADDVDFIVHWTAIQNWDNLRELAIGQLPGGHEGVYRPVRSFLYVIAYQLWGVDPMKYHVLALSIHLMSTALVYSISQEVAKNKTVTYTATLVFGLHPMHTEAISFTITAFDTIASMLALASIRLWIRELSKEKLHKTRQIWSILLAGLAIYTQEIMIVIPLLLHAFLLLIKRIPLRHQFKHTLPYWLIAVSYLTLRFGVLDITSRGGYLANSFLKTQLVSIKVLLAYVWMYIWPWHPSIIHELPGGYSSFNFPEINHFLATSETLDMIHLTGIIGLFLIAIFSLRQYKSHPIHIFALAWIAISLLPVLHILPGATLVAEKYTYLASVGVSIMCGLVMHKLLIKYKRHALLLLVSFAVLMMVFGYTTYTRNLTWKDELTFWQHTVAAHPNNPRASLELATIYQRHHDIQHAIAMYERTIALYPTISSPYHELLTLYANTQNYEAMVTTGEQALTYFPEVSAFPFRTSQAYVNVANNFIKSDGIDQAIEALTKAVSLDPNNVEASRMLSELQ